MSQIEQVASKQKPFSYLLRNYTVGFILIIFAAFVAGFLRENFTDIVSFFGDVFDSFVLAFSSFDSPWTLVSVGGACAFGIGVLLLGGFHFNRRMSKLSLVVLACLISTLFLVWGVVDHALVTNHPDFRGSSGFADIATVMMKSYVVIPGVMLLCYVLNLAPLIINWGLGPEAAQPKESHSSDGTIAGKSSCVKL